MPVNSTLTLDGGNLIATGNLTVTTNNLTFATDQTLGGNFISVSSPVGETNAFRISGPGVGTIAGTDQANFQAAANLVFAGNADLQLSGPTTFISGATNQIQLQSGASITPGSQLSFVAGTGGLNGDTGGIHGGFTLVSIGGGAGTISSSGNVILNGPVTFIGENLAILAAGNIIANTTTSINLSSTTGSGGNLVMIAGYNFTGTASQTPIQGSYTIAQGGQSTTGGSIEMPKLSINTSSTAKTVTGGIAPTGGNVLAVAHAGSVNAGVVTLGAINTAADPKVGAGGSVTIIAQGGINTGAISTKAATGGAVNLLAEQPTISGASVTISHGSMYGGGVFLGIDPNTVGTAAGAGISVTGAITTAGSVNNGGNVHLVADQQIAVSGGIAATGLSPAAVAGGNVTIDSVLSSVIIGSSGVNTSAGRGIALSTSAPSAGNITIDAESYIQSGSLLAVGGSNNGTGAGGIGGDIALTMAKTTTINGSMAFGKATITGFISTSGGSGSKSTGGASSFGGNAGDVTIDAGSLAITGVTQGNSIAALGGIAGKSAPAHSNGNAGDVSITTYAIQQMPSNFDLTSTTANIAVRPGGQISVGTSSPVNGVAGNIAAGTTLTKTSALGFTVAGLYNTSGATTFGTAPGTISFDVVGPNSSSFNPTSGARPLVTPAGAVADYQLNRGQTPISLGWKGPQGDSSFDQTDLNGTTFTAFKVPAGVELEFTGHLPTLNLPSSTLLAGDLVFPTANSIGFINFGSGAFVNTGTIDATGAATLVLSGTASTWTNNGNLLANQVVLARPTSATLTFVSGSTSTTTIADSILLSTGADVGMAINFKVNGIATPNTAPVVSSATSQ